MKRAVLTVALAAPLLVLIQAAAASLLLREIPAPPESGMALALLSSALTAMLLAVLALHMTVRGPARVAVLFLVSGGIALNSLVEAYFFPLGIPAAQVRALALQEALVAGLFAIVLDRLAGATSPSGRPAESDASASSTAGRLAACDALYVALYF